MSTGLRQVLFCSVLLALPVGSYFVVFKPVNQRIKQGRDEIEHKKSMLEKLREATSQTEDLQKANEQVKQAIDSMQAQLPSTKEMDNVLRQVSGLASKNGLRVPQFKKRDGNNPAGLAMEQPLDIEITGDHDGFYQFLIELEQLPRLTRITDLSVTRSDKVDGEIKTKFSLSVYYEAGKGD